METGRHLCFRKPRRHENKDTARVQLSSKQLKGCICPVRDMQIGMNNYYICREERAERFHMHTGSCRGALYEYGNVHLETLRRLDAAPVITFLSFHL